MLPTAFPKDPFIFHLTPFKNLVIQGNAQLPSAVRGVLSADMSFSRLSPKLLPARRPPPCLSPSHHSPDCQRYPRRYWRIVARDAGTGHLFLRRMSPQSGGENEDGEKQGSCTNISHAQRVSV